MPALSHPAHLAKEIAELLDSDPIAAAQVQEHLPDGRLYELLDLPPMPPAYDPSELENFTDDEVISELRRRGFTKVELLRLLR